MKRPFAAAFATAALAAPGFVLAQAPPPGPPPSGPPPVHLPPSGPPSPHAASRNLWSLERREYWLEQRISHGLAEGSISPDEAQHVRHELADLRYQEVRLRAVNGGPLPDRDRAKLEARLDALSDEVHWLRDIGERRPWR